MSARKKNRRPARRRLGDMERYGLLALGAGMVLGIGVLTEQLHRAQAQQRAQEQPVAVTAAWDWEEGRVEGRETLAALEQPAPTPGGGEGQPTRAVVADPVRNGHFDFFEPPVHLPGVTMASIPPPPDSTRTGGRMVAVRDGDTLQKIARRELGSSSLWPRILQANPGIDPRRLQKDQLVLLPDATRSATQTADTVPANSSARTYVVRKRDTLESISLRHYGTRTRWTDILEANRDRIKSPERLSIGVRIRIPQ